MMGEEGKGNEDDEKKEERRHREENTEKREKGRVRERARCSWTERFSNRSVSRFVVISGFVR